jgi:hypothetical protein
MTSGKMPVLVPPSPWSSAFLAALSFEDEELHAKPKVDSIARAHVTRGSFIVFSIL